MAINLSGLRGDALRGSALRGNKALAMVGVTLGARVSLASGGSVVLPTTIQLGAPSTAFTRSGGLRGWALRGSALRGFNNYVSVPPTNAANHSLKITATIVFPATIKLSHGVGLGGARHNQTTPGLNLRGMRGAAMRGAKMRGGGLGYSFSGGGPIPVTVLSSVAMAFNTGLTIAATIVYPATIRLGASTQLTVPTTTVEPVPGGPVQLAATEGLKVTATIVYPTTIRLGASTGLSVGTSTIPPVQPTIGLGASSGLKITTTTIPPIAVTIRLGASVAMKVVTKSGFSLSATHSLRITVELIVPAAIFIAPLRPLTFAAQARELTFEASDRPMPPLVATAR